jgi:hypothetical protein
MADANATQQQKKEQLAEEIDQVEEDLAALHVLYEKFFLGIDRKPPDKERKSVVDRLRNLRVLIVKNTAQKFRINTLFAKLISFERMWDRTLREIEEGTYKRDVFKAKYRIAKKQPQQREDDVIVEEELPPEPRIELSDEKVRRIYDTFLHARRRTGEPTEGITYAAIADKLRAQVPVLMERFGARSVEFKVVIKAGKAVLKAVPHT